MPVSITCIAARKRGSKLYLRYSDKTELEFESRQQAIEYCQTILDDTKARDFLRACMLAKALRQGAAENVVEQLAGKVATLDLTLVNVVRST
jgi:DNA-binding GntR family transcriptional regulator